MREGRTLARRATGMAVAILLAGCGLEHWQAYPGEARPQAEVARLRPEGLILGLGLRPVLRTFDSVPMQKERAFTKRYDIEMLPGPHEIEVKVTGNDGVATVIESETLTLQFEAAAGAVYELRVESASWQPRWAGWIVDCGTGKTVSRVKPWPRAHE